MLPRLAACLCVCCLLQSAVAGSPRSDLIRESKLRSVESWTIACPVLAGLYQRGELKPDEYGRVTATELKQALEKTYVSSDFAQFQGTGIAGYKGDDPHQNVRLSTSGSAIVETLYLNVFNMNVGDNCEIAGNQTSIGKPCNANTQFQQHGFSTTLRDTRYDSQDPTRTKRFDFWIGTELVDPTEADAKLNTAERVLLFDGFARMLAKARSGKGDSPMLSGDFSGEYSLTADGQWDNSGIKKWHPSVTDPNKYTALATWQPLLAWAGWWHAFSREEGNVRYFTESDLKTIFIQGAFPESWSQKSWGFQENFETIIALEGKGVGDTWISIVKTLMLSDFVPFRETAYNLELLKTMIGLGISTDSVHKVWPPESRNKQSAEVVLV